MSNKGFSLVEVLVGTALLVIVMIAFYGSYSSLFQIANASKFRTLAVQLADEQFEIIRNMPYINVGLTTGIPLGVLPQTQTLSRGGTEFIVNLTIRNINLSTSTVQASDKLVEIEVNCAGCPNFQPVVLTGQISPANLASAGNGGAMAVQVFDAGGGPVVGATVDLQSVATSSVQNTDVTNNFGVLNIIGVPPGSDMYRIEVGKVGYSTDRTYPIGGAGNPDPVKPDATVLDQLVTNISFSIDRFSSINVSSVNFLCSPRPNFNFSMTGAKQIGTGVPKYSQALETNGSGELTLDSMEWDTYTVTPTDANYEVAGINPISPFSLNPDNSQNLQFVVVPKNPNSLMVTVIDGITGLPLSGAEVRLQNTSGYDATKITGQGYLSQTDWSGGAGQDIFSDITAYFAGNGNIDTATSSGDILMKEIFGEYNTNATGTLESSTFDIGTTSNFYALTWTPSSQPALTGDNSVKFQFASNASSSDPWNFMGPDGTASTYYLIPNTPISVDHNGKRYVRYLTYLTTNTATVTPMVSDVSFSYTSGCIPPGQVIYQGLSSGTYNITVSKTGYTTYTAEVSVVSGWREEKVIISP